MFVTMATRDLTQVLAANKQQAADKFGAEIDRLENLHGALQLGMPAEFHVRQLREALPDVARRLKEAYVELLGENPWG